MRAVVEFISPASQHLRRRRLPHLGRRAAAARSTTCPTRNARRGPLALSRRSAQRAPSSPAIRRFPSITSFAITRKQVIGGAFDWIYDHLGMFSWVVEIWSPMREAGIDKYLYIDWFRDHPIEDDLKLFRWNEDEAWRRCARGLEAVRPPAARSRGDRRLESLPCVRQSAAAISRARGRAFPEVAAVAGAAVAEARARRTQAQPARRPTRGLSRWSSRTPAGCRAMSASARSSARSCVASIAEIALPPGAKLDRSASGAKSSGQLEGKAYKHTGDFVLAGLPRHRRS